LVLEQVKMLREDAIKHKLSDDFKFEIFSGSNELLSYGLDDVCEAFYFAEKYLENYESIQAEIWKDENTSYSGEKLEDKITEFVLKTKA
jgi:hypothetical protein